MNSLTKQEKIILGVVVVVSVLLLCGVYVLRDDIASLFVSEEDGSLVVTDEIEEETTYASIAVRNIVNGEAAIYLVVTEPVSLAGAELYFDITGDLDVQEVTCGEDFSCIEKEVKDGVLTISAIREPTVAEEVLSGEIEVVNFSYDSETSGNLVINSEDSSESLVVKLNPAVNILEVEEKSFSIGIDF